MSHINPDSPRRPLRWFPFRGKHLCFLWLLISLQWPCLWRRRCVQQRASFPCYSRCENLSVRCLRVLIRKVAEYLTLDSWQIIGGPFGNPALLGSKLMEEVIIMGCKSWRKGYGATSHNFSQWRMMSSFMASNLWPVSPELLWPTIGNSNEVPYYVKQWESPYLILLYCKTF